MTAGTEQIRIEDIPLRIRNQMYAHVLPELENEVGGVLVGKLDGRTGKPKVTGAIEALEAVGERASVTFTHEAWEVILERQEEDFPNTQIVGWYHSHPGFGIFLSEHDLFIHRNFFSDAHQFAYVIDPVERTEGIFGWRDGDLAPLDQRALDGAAGGGAPLTGAAAAGAAAGAAAAGSHGKLTVDLSDLEDPEPARAGSHGDAPFTVAAADLAPPTGAPIASPAGAGLGAPPIAGAPRGTAPGSSSGSGAGGRKAVLAAVAGAVVLAIGVGAVALGGGGGGEGSEASGGVNVVDSEAERQLKAQTAALVSQQGQVASQIDAARVATKPKPTPKPDPVVNQGPANPVQPPQQGPEVAPGGVAPAAPSAPAAPAAPSGGNKGGSPSKCLVNC